MRLINSTLFSLVMLLSISCGGPLHIKEQTGLSDLSRFSIRNGNSLTIKIPEGRHVIQNTSFIGGDIDELIISGGKRCTLVLDQPFLELDSEVLSSGEFLRDINPGEKSVNTPGIKASEGDIITLISDKITEIGWDTKSFFTTTIKKTQAGSVIFEHPVTLPFEVKDGARYQVRKPVKVHIENIHFECSRLNKKRAITIRGASVSTQKLSAISERSKENDFIELQACVNNSLQKSELEGFRYGFLLNFSTDTNITGVVANDTYHAVAPATWSLKTMVENYTGNNTTIDAHPSFYVTYRNVRINSSSTKPNCRSLGVRLENCEITSGSTNKNAVYIGPIGLADDLEYLRYEYDIVLDGVKWIHNSPNPVSFAVYGCRNLLVNKFEGFGLNERSLSKESRITNSVISDYFPNSLNALIENVEFITDNGSGIKNEKSLIGVKGGKFIQFKNCHFISEGGSLFKFSFNNSRVQFYDCKFEGIVRQFKDDKDAQNGSSVDFFKCEVLNRSQEKVNFMPK